MRRALVTAAAIMLLVAGAVPIRWSSAASGAAGTLSASPVVPAAAGCEGAGAWSE